MISEHLWITSLGGTVGTVEITVGTNTIELIGTDHGTLVIETITIDV